MRRAKSLTQAPLPHASGVTDVDTHPNPRCLTFPSTGNRTQDHIRRLRPVLGPNRDKDTAPRGSNARNGEATIEKKSENVL